MILLPCNTGVSLTHSQQFFISAPPSSHTHKSMDNQENIEENLDDSIKEDEFPDEFQCCVCLDLLYKPIVLACGHMACFWCMYKSMDLLRESRCPYCRKPYNHFPRSCRLLHFLLQKLYPAAFKRREKQVSEEEEKSGNVSQPIDNHKSDLHLNEEVSASVAPKSDATVGESPLISAQTAILEDGKTNTMTANSGTYTTMLQDGLTRDEFSNLNHKEVVVSDVTCVLCKQLLYRPLVLNCGDVYCEACIISASDKVCKCPVCQSPHPNGFPSVCLVLEHFLEEQFNEEYAARRESSLRSVNGHVSTSISSKQNQEQAAKGSSVPTDVYTSWWLGQGPKVHLYVGCDYCGMSPIIGERYKCKDCKEKIGFDLCGECYNSSCKLPGRFNQQHTEDHQFEIVEPFDFNRVILRIGPEQEEGSPTSFSANDGPEDEGDNDDVPILMDDFSEDEGL